MLPYEIPLALSVHPGHVDCALALDESNHLRHGELQRDGDQHACGPSRSSMAFVDPTFLLLRQPAKDLLQMFSQLHDNVFRRHFGMKTT